jgi:hypothetical protein
MTNRRVEALASTQQLELATNKPHIHYLIRFLRNTLPSSTVGSVKLVTVSVDMLGRGGDLTIELLRVVKAFEDDEVLSLFDLSGSLSIFGHDHHAVFSVEYGERHIYRSYSRNQPISLEHPATSLAAQPPPPPLD